jgi:hypothetical protein
MTPTIVSEVLVGFIKQVLKHYLGQDHDCFLPNPLQFIILVINSEMYNLLKESLS